MVQLMSWSNIYDKVTRLVNVLTKYMCMCSGHPGRESRNNSGLQLNH